MTITLNEVKYIYEFAGVAHSCFCDVIATQGRYRVNAKSILGLFSLDLTKPIEVSLENPISKDEEKIKEFCNRVRVKAVLNN